METGLNSLYTVIAECTAAIVAILGGFITTQILSLAADRQNLVRELEETEAQLTALIERWKERSDLYETMRVESFFDSIKDELAGDPLPPLEQIVHNYPNWELDPDILQREYSKLTGRILEARHFISQYIDRISFEDSSVFKDWLTKHDIDISGQDYDLVKREFDREIERQREIERERERQKTTLFGIAGILPSIRYPSLPWLTTMSGLQQQTRDQRRDRTFAMLNETITEIADQIVDVNSRKTHLHSQIGAFQYPQHWEKGLTILVYFAVVGIILPLVLIAIRCDDKYPALSQIVVLILFSSGLVAVFGYIWYQLRATSIKH
jgi:hypothetical protein